MSAAAKLKTGAGTASDHDPKLDGWRAECIAFLADNQTLDVISAVCEPRFPGLRVRDGGSRQALEYLAEGSAPRILIVDITDSPKPLTAVLPIVAAFTDATKVIAIGTVNDINFYREMIEAGVTEYLVKPVTEKTLTAALARIDEQAAQVRPAVEGESRPVIAVLGARGGVGASTVAINCAWLIAQEQKRQAMLLDLDLQYGTVALALDIEPTRGLREVLENPSRIDSLFISSASAKLGARLAVMAAEETVDDDVHYDAAAITLLLDELRRQSDCVIVDLPRSAAAVRAKVLNAATDVAIVTDLTLVGLRDSIRLYGLVQQFAPNARLAFVANRASHKESSVPKADFERALGHSLDFLVPEDAKAMAAAANNGKPLVAVAAGSKMVPALRKIAARLSNGEAAVAKRRFWPLASLKRKKS